MSRGRWAVAWMVAVLIGLPASGCTARRPDGDQPELAQQAAEAAEADPHLAGVVSQHTKRIGCVAEVFGSDSRSRPRVVYAQLFCGGVPVDGQPGEAQTLIAPAAITLGSEPAVQVPSEGGDWTAAVHRVIPERWWKEAEAGPADPEALKKRLDQRLASLSSTGP